MRQVWRWVLLMIVFALAGCGNGDDPGAAAPFNDTFDTPGEWHTSSDPEVEIGYADGGLSIEIKVIDRVAWSVVGRKIKDGIVSVDATAVGGPHDNAFGLVVRHVGDRRFYRFEISSDGFFAVQVPKGNLGWEYLVDWKESAAIRRGQETNRLKVMCEGSTMVFFVNDVELTRIRDGRFTEGDVGVIAGTFYSEPGTHILFDNFKIEPLE